MDCQVWHSRFGQRFLLQWTVFSGVRQPINIPEIPPLPPLENKVYVAFILSDGDNIQYMQHAMKMNWGKSRAGAYPSAGRPLRWRWIWIRPCSIIIGTRRRPTTALFRVLPARVMRILIVGVCRIWRRLRRFPALPATQRAAGHHDLGQGKRTCGTGVCQELPEFARFDRSGRLL